MTPKKTASDPEGKDAVVHIDQTKILQKERAYEEVP
jgi:hypothetical protein